MKRTANSAITITELLNGVQLTEVERWEARGHAARAEAFADLIVAALRGIRALGHAIDRTSRLPARTTS
jgi:hypothetical protein